MTLQPAFPFAFASAPLSAPLPASPDTVLITDDYSLGAGQHLNLDGTPGLKVIVRQGADIDVNLKGQVTVSNPFGRAVGLVTTESTHGLADISVTGRFETVAGGEGNAAEAFMLRGANDTLAIDGQVEVTSLEGDAFGIQSSGSNAQVTINGDVHLIGNHSAYGVMAGGGGVVTNHGLINAAAQNVAVGCVGQGGSLLTSDGEIRAWGVRGPSTEAGTIPLALGVATLGGALSNSGQIIAASHFIAVGAELIDATNAVNQAGGVIEARITGGHSIGIGVLMGSISGGATQFENHGLVRGQTAISSTLPALSKDGAPQESVSSDIVVNLGHIVGDISLGQLADMVTNGDLTAKGVIHGDLDLGSGDDVFDTHLGKFEGVATGGEGSDTLIGGGSAETLYGDAPGGPDGAGDLICGYKGDDTIDGGVGDDVINGGRGADQLTGGSEADAFVYNRVEDSSALGMDLIADLQDLDTIDLHRIDADTSTGFNDAFHLVSSFSGAAGELVVSYDALADMTTISGDVDGDGVANLVIQASGDHSDYSNFLL